MVGTNGETQTNSWEVEITPQKDTGFEYKCSRSLKGDKLELTSELSYEDSSEAEKAAEETILRFGSD